MSEAPLATRPSDAASGVAPIFAQVLGRASVGDDEDFFDLGGDSILAVTLVLEVERTIGVSLPVTAIYDAPTPRTMARMVAEGSSELASRLVLLRPGELPALFLPHGLLGLVSDLRGLARALDTVHAVYGIEPVGRDGTEAPLPSVEAMARRYVDDIKQVQPHGPYYLAGYCFGGLIALEMAQELKRRGDHIAMLAMLDTFTHSAHWPLPYRIASWARIAASHVTAGTWTNMARYLWAQMRSLPPRKRLPYLATCLGRGAAAPFSLFRLSVMLHRFERPAEAAATDVPRPAAIERISASNVRAFAAYAPRFFDGEITHLRALARKRVQFDGRALWRHVARSLEIGKVPAHDYEAGGTLVPYFAPQLSACLRRAGARTTDTE